MQGRLPPCPSPSQACPSLCDKQCLLPSTSSACLLGLCVAAEPVGQGVGAVLFHLQEWEGSLFSGRGGALPQAQECGGHPG